MTKNNDGRKLEGLAGFSKRKRNLKKKKYFTQIFYARENFFLFQWPKMIISVLVTWMIVDCNLAVRVVLSF